MASLAKDKRKKGSLKVDEDYLNNLASSASASSTRTPFAAAVPAAFTVTAPTARIPASTGPVPASADMLSPSFSNDLFRSPVPAPAPAAAAETPRTNMLNRMRSRSFSEAGFGATVCNVDDDIEQVEQVVNERAASRHRLQANPVNHPVLYDIVAQSFQRANNDGVELPASQEMNEIVDQVYPSPVRKHARRGSGPWWTPAVLHMLHIVTHAVTPKKQLVRDFVCKFEEDGSEK